MEPLGANDVFGTRAEGAPSTDDDRFGTLTDLFTRASTPNDRSPAGGQSSPGSSSSSRSDSDGSSSRSRSEASSSVAAPRARSPEGERKEWDNRVTLPDLRFSRSSTELEAREDHQATRDAYSKFTAMGRMWDPWYAGTFAKTEPASPEPREEAAQKARGRAQWSSRHHLTFKNEEVNRLSRSYFDRWREPEAFRLHRNARCVSRHSPVNRELSASASMPSLRRGFLSPTESSASLRREKLQPVERLPVAWSLKGPRSRAVIPGSLTLRGLSPDVTKSDLEEHFQLFGTLKAATVPGTGTGCVSFEDPAQASCALACPEHVVKPGGCALRVEQARAAWRPAPLAEQLRGDTCLGKDAERRQKLRDAWFSGPFDL